MNSRNTLVAAAVAMALGSTAALAQTNPIIANPPTYTIYAAGGSSEANSVYVAANNLLNITANYTGASGGAADASYRVLYGTLKSAYTANGVTVNAGTPILFYFRDSGGSFPNGAEPFATVSPTTLKYSSLTSLQSATSTGNALPAANWQYSNDQAVTTAPDWGLTDEEVPLFNYPYNLPYANGTTYISGSHPQEAAATVGQSDAIYDDVYGVAVTANVFANKTNFTKEEINGIWTGTLTDWCQINGDNGTQLTTCGVHPIVLLDRNQGSGTKAAGSLYFLNYPTGIATGSQNVPASIQFPSSVARYAHGGYQDVIESSSTNLVADLVSAQSNGDWAIGIVVAEAAPITNAAGSPAVNTWDFVAIDNQVIDSVGNINGASTNYSNVIRGGYDFFYQVAFNTRTGFLSLATANAALANAWKAEFQLPAFAGVVSHTAFPAAVNGIVLDADKNAFGAGVTTGSRKSTSEKPLGVLYDATSSINATINANADPL